MADSNEKKANGSKDSGVYGWFWNPIHKIFRSLLGFLAGITHPWIINTVAVCVCLIIIVATCAAIPSLYRIIKGTGETLEKPIDIAKRVASATSEIASDVVAPIEQGVKGTSDLLTGAKNDPRPEYANATDPFKSREENLAAVSSETREALASSGGVKVTAISQNSPGSLFASESLDLRLPDEVAHSLRDPSIKRALLKRGDEIKTTRRAAVNEIFDRVESKIPAFVVDHYEDRNKGETFINLMNRQLLTEEELEGFIANTAFEIDSAIAEIVSRHLDAKYLNIDFNTDTGRELKKRLPKAREICESIYQVLERKEMTSERKSELLRSYDSLVLKYPKLSQVSKTAFVVIIGALYPPSVPYVAGALVLSWLHDIKVYEQRSAFEKELGNQFNDRRNRFNKMVEKSIDDLITIYSDSLAKSRIEVRQPFFKP